MNYLNPTEKLHLQAHAAKEIIFTHSQQLNFKNQKPTKIATNIS